MIHKLLTCRKYYIGFSFLVFMSCLTPKVSTDVTMKPLPTDFSMTADSVNASNDAMVNWKQYFSDSVLVNLIDTALINNLDYLTALQKINASRAQVKYAKGLSAPKVDAVAVAGQERFGDYTIDGVGNFDTNLSPNITDEQQIPNPVPEYYLGFHSSWEVDVWSRLKNKRKAAAANYLATIEGKNWIITSIITEVATTYYELLALDNEIEIIDETIELQEEQIEIVSIQKEAARANELVVNQFKALLLNYKILKLDLTQKVIQTENKLNYLLGRYPQEIYRDKSMLDSITLTNVQIGIPSDLLNNRPDIKKAEHELTATKANLRAARAAFYPSFNITAMLGLHSFNPTYIFSPQSIAYNAFGSMIAPLINQSAIKAHFRTAKAEQVEAMYNYQKSILTGYVEVYNQMTYIDNLNKMYILQNQKVNLLSKSIETASELFLTGRATYLEVIITRTATLNSKLDLVDIKKKQLTAAVNIYRALGGGWN
jgi:outer membrane protein, multidrug efflux system